MPDHVHDWINGTCECGLTIVEHVQAMRARIRELEGALDVVNHCSKQLVVCQRCAITSHNALANKIPL